MKELITLAIDWCEKRQFGSSEKVKQDARSTLVKRLSYWEGLAKHSEKEFKQIWNSKRHKVNAREHDKMVKEAYQQKQAPRKSKKHAIQGWVVTIFKKFVVATGKRSPTHQLYKTAAEQFEHYTGVKKEITLATINDETFGLTGLQGPDTFRRRVADYEEILYLFALYLKNNDLFIASVGAYGETQRCRQGIFKAVYNREQSPIHAKPVQMLNDTSVLPRISSVLFEFYEKHSDFLKNKHLAVKKLELS